MITLTREEAHQLLVALQELNRLSIGENAICLPAEIDDAMEVLEARLAQPKHWSDCAVHSEPAYPAGECDCGGVQPEPEPVAWFCELPDNKISIKIVGKPTEGNWKPLYAAPPQREWQGLTDDEIKEILDCGRPNLVNIKKAEQKLKEKNT